MRTICNWLFFFFDWVFSLTLTLFKQNPGDSEGQGSLVCCSPWGWKELDTEQCCLHFTQKAKKVSVICFVWKSRYTSLQKYFLWHCSVNLFLFCLVLLRYIGGSWTHVFPQANWIGRCTWINFLERNSGTSWVILEEMNEEKSPPKCGSVQKAEQKQPSPSFSLKGVDLQTLKMLSKCPASNQSTHKC